MRKILEIIKNSKTYIFLNQGKKENLWIHWLWVLISAVVTAAIYYWAWIKKS